jgi:hypothetical protein
MAFVILIVPLITRLYFKECYFFMNLITLLRELLALGPCLTHFLTLLKSQWPNHQLSPIPYHSRVLFCASSYFACPWCRACSPFGAWAFACLNSYAHWPRSCHQRSLLYSLGPSSSNWPRPIQTQAKSGIFKPALRSYVSTVPPSSLFPSFLPMREPKGFRYAAKHHGWIAGWRNSGLS